jgi:dihydrodipicolinate synthase/N-acetylneuraminate lyase
MTFHGIHAIVYALFDENERLDRAAMRRQVQACLAAACTAWPRSAWRPRLPS